MQAGIAAALNGLYRFAREQAAADKLTSILSGFTLTKEQPETGATLWIRNYNLTPEDEEKGFMGHFAHLHVQRMDDEDGHYTIAATPIEKELRFHPVRKRTPQRAPNWGHPVLRGVKSERTYPTLEAAEAVLQQLHLEYPETTIPGANKLYLMIFSREETPAKPLQKYVLEITNLQGGGFTIISKKNEYKPKPKTKTAPPIPSAQIEGEEGDAAPQQPGHFASMVALKRNRKKK